MGANKNTGRFDAELLYQDNEMSVALITLYGKGEHIINHGSFTIYEVVSGIGMVVLDNVAATEFVQTGMKFGIEAGCGYQDEGDLVMLATCKPPFDPSTIEVLD